MFGKLKRGFKYIDTRFMDDLDRDDMKVFEENEVVEIVRELIDDSFITGKGYLILTANLDALTVDSDFIEIIEDVS